ncbi:MAG: alpha-L-rhamnosidase C-terminal domain-containing protein [Bacteroidales bacterium]|nr:alpha-L-rhamnosidase C-terminal domain-containing protein [Bacteroidales bacterium]
MKFNILLLTIASLLLMGCNKNCESENNIDTTVSDKFITEYLSPTRIVWISDSTNKAVVNPENLLKPFSGQVSVTSRNVTFLNTKQSDKASVLLDFGKEIQGGIQIAAGIRAVNRPVKVKVTLGESVTEALSTIETSNATNDHAMREIEIALPWLGSIEIGNSGFRFARIDLLEKDIELPLVGVRAKSVYRDISYFGSFNCDNERLNQIWKTGAYTVHLNMQEYLWDGIKRDRLVWLGDLHPEVMTVSTVFGNADVVNKSLDFAREDTPLPGWMNGMCAYSLWWIIIQKDWYMYQGNLEYLKEQQSYLNGLVDQLYSQIDGNKENLQGGGRFLDWPTSEKPDVVHAGLQALMLMSFRAASQLAGYLEDTQLKAKCDDAVSKLEKYSPDPVNNKQAASLMGINGLLDIDKACQIVNDGGAHGFSTFYGYYMLESLAKGGKIDEALKIISDYWGGMIDLGATTFWEDLTFEDLPKAGRIDEVVPEDKYDIHADGGAYCYVGLRHSFCHGWASGPTPWLSEYVLGIKPASPGFETVRIKPNLGSLKWAEGTFPTPKGIIKVRHEKQSNGEVKSKISLPKGVKLVD